MLTIIIFSTLTSCQNSAALNETIKNSEESTIKFKIEVPSSVGIETK